MRAKKIKFQDVLHGKSNATKLALNIRYLQYIYIQITESFSQLGTLGAGNHYAEIQIVEEIYDGLAATRMGIEEKGQVSGLG